VCVRVSLSFSLVAFLHAQLPESYKVSCSSCRGRISSLANQQVNNSAAKNREEEEGGEGGGKCVEHEAVATSIAAPVLFRMLGHPPAAAGVLPVVGQWEGRAVVVPGR
jgi:hypothetical protein